MNTTAPWHARELGRFGDGTYKTIPVQLAYPATHFVHLSTAKTEEDYIAYTPSDAYGEADRQVRLKFGRYLHKVFTSMTDADIQARVTELKSAVQVSESPASLYFATDVEMINRIFETEMCACGSTVSSCMHGKFAEQRIRPYHVYADSPDVAVAYVMADGAIVSRSVVSTKNKVWVRCYSVTDGDNDTDCRTLRSLLADAGYRKGDLRGNRLTMLSTSHVMLPYIDEGGMGVRDEGKYWVVCEKNEGDYNANCTDGSTTETGDRCECCNSRPADCECYTCECCESVTQDGCDSCSICEYCDSCTVHNGCDCDRCSDCGELVTHYRGCSSCQCDRCESCNALEDDCDCEKCDECGNLIDNCDCPDEAEDEGDATETDAPVMVAETETQLTADEARHKLNRAFLYLRKAYGADFSSKEYLILKAAFDAIETTPEVIAA